MRVKPSSEAEKLQYSLRLGKERIVQAMFGTKQQSRIGGAALLLKFELIEGIVAGAAACLRDWRLQSQINFTLYQLLWQRVLLICCGYEDVIDGQLLAHDAGLGLALIPDSKGKTAVASQPTICRFENKVSKTNCYRLAAWLVFSYISTHKRAPASIRLDFDGSCVPTFGKQSGTSFRAYYDTEMYFPLFVFDQDGVLITAILRPGEDGEARMTIPVLKRLVRAFREVWSDVEILVVMDAAFAGQKIYDWCEDHDVKYLIKLKNSGGKGSGLFSHSHELAKLCKESFGRRFGVGRYLDGKTKKSDLEKSIRTLKKRPRREALSELHRRVERRFGEFRYQAGKGGKDKKQWRQPRRILAECIYDDWGSRRTFWITNIVGSEAEQLINEVYSRRGEAELRIKDAKAFRCDKLSCQEFVPNQCRLLMHVLAQRLLFSFRRLLPAGFQQKSLTFVREHFICIPAIVEGTGKRIRLSWSCAHPFKHAMYALCSRLSKGNSASARCQPHFQAMLIRKNTGPPLAA